MTSEQDMLSETYGAVITRSARFIVHRWGAEFPTPYSTYEMNSMVRRWLTAHVNGQSDQPMPTIWLWHGYNAPSPIELVTVTRVSTVPYDEHDYGYETWEITTRSGAFYFYVTVRVDGRA